MKCPDGRLANTGQHPPLTRFDFPDLDLAIFPSASPIFFFSLSLSLPLSFLCTFVYELLQSLSPCFVFSSLVDPLFSVQRRTSKASRPGSAKPCDQSYLNTTTNHTKMQAHAVSEACLHIGTHTHTITAHHLRSYCSERRE